MKLWFWIIVLGVSVIFFLGATLPNSIAVDTLKKQGFTDVEVTGRWPFVALMFGCGEGYIVAFKVSATDAKGERIEKITVCAGLFKGTTTRF